MRTFDTSILRLNQVAERFPWCDYKIGMGVIRFLGALTLYRASARDRSTDRGLRACDYLANLLADIADDPEDLARAEAEYQANEHLQLERALQTQKEFGGSLPTYLTWTAESERTAVEAARHDANLVLVLCRRAIVWFGVVQSLREHIIALHESANPGEWIFVPEAWPRWRFWAEANLFQAPTEAELNQNLPDDVSVTVNEMLAAAGVQKD